MLLEFRTCHSTCSHVTQSEIYSPVLGSSSLPMEYYVIPTDEYLPYWISVLDDQGVNPPQPYLDEVRSVPVALRCDVLKYCSEEALCITCGANSLYSPSYYIHVNDDVNKGPQMIIFMLDSMFQVYPAVIKLFK